MDAHELAIAALQEVAHPRSHRRDIVTGKVASSLSRPNATGGDMNNAIDDNAAHAQELSSGAQGAKVNPGESQNSALDSRSTSNDNSQSTADGHEVSTPPTSASDGVSSQSTSQDQLSQLSQLSQLAAAQPPMTSSSTARPMIATAGQKRTADGQVKPPSPPSPQVPRVRGHSRNTSAVSNTSVASSRIGEVNKAFSILKPPINITQLSSELKTRLSYAMVKVNNGWQSNTIEEVESLASAAGSPTSSTSTLHGLRTTASPRIAMIALGGNSVSVAPQSQTPGDFDLYSRTEPQSRTYESFWRDHSSIPRPQATKSLAPPADIRPTSLSTQSSRRSQTPKFTKVPTIPGQGSNSSLNTHTSAPRTPLRTDFSDQGQTFKGGEKIQTPSQKTMKEQDAIETLLFMSSPGNSGNMGAPPPFQRRGEGGSPPQNSPLRTEFPRGERRVAFEKSTGKEMGNGKGRERGPPGGGEREKEKSRLEAIDRLLDEMGDAGESSDEEEVVLSYPSRGVAGRV